MISPRCRNRTLFIERFSAIALFLSVVPAAWSDPATPPQPPAQTSPALDPSRLQAERDLLRAEVERLRAQRDDAERTRLEQQLAGAQARAERLDARVATVLDLARKMEAERNALSAKVDEQRTRVEAAEAKAQRLLQERESALETNLALQSQKREADSRLETEMQRVSDQLLQIEGLQADLVSAQEAVRTLDGQRAEAHARALDLQVKLDACISRADISLSAPASGDGSAGEAPAGDPIRTNP